MPIQTYCYKANHTCTVMQNNHLFFLALLHTNRKNVVKIKTVGLNKHEFCRS